MKVSTQICHLLECSETILLVSLLHNVSHILSSNASQREPSHLVMPLILEPTKPRLCNDNRFLNFWMQDRPFFLDHLYQLQLYVDKDTYQIVCDDKSGYDPILLTDSSRTYFGFEWGAWFFSSNTIPFGWKLSAFVYHSAG